MQIGKKKFIAVIVIAFLAGGLFTAGGFALAQGGLGKTVSVPRDEYKEMHASYERYDKLQKLYRLIETSFYQDVDENALLEGAYKGMTEALGDPYSAYMNAEEYANWKTALQGEYSGVGVTFSQDADGNYVVVSVEQGSPADEAGLQTGDILLAADGKTYDNMDLLANAIRGDAGTQVELTYTRNGKENTVSMTREKIVQHSVSHKMLDQDTGYIAITSFMESTAEDFREALKAVTESGAKKLVLDLRDNGGGLLNACIDVADEFLDQGIVVSVEGKSQERMEYESKDGKTALKTVVLVNENSASAAEILAAALKDNGFALVGQTTFGKGVIQSTNELEDGSALKLTIMEYFSPKGNAIHEKGVVPNHEVKDDENTEIDEQLQKARELL